VLGEEHPHTADSYNNRAMCLDAQGKHAQALPLYENDGCGDGNEPTAPPNALNAD